jgi:copper(I)-binding protein
MKHNRLAVVALAATLAVPAGWAFPPAHAASAMMASHASSWAVGDLVVSGAYARATLPHAPVGGGFISITNKGTADDTLVSATSPLAGDVELHEMAMKDGVMSMRPLPKGVLIPAGKTVTFSPSGLHLMFMKLKGSFVKGKTVPVTLSFARAGSVTIELQVGGIAASAPPGATARPAGNSMSGMKM